MKKAMLLALVLALAVPALGAAAQPSLEDLRAAIFAPALGGAIAPSAAPLQRAACHVQTRCTDGTLISCTGMTTTDCEVEVSCFVICSHHRTQCSSPCP